MTWPLFAFFVTLTYFLNGCKGWHAPKNLKYNQDCEILRLNASLLISSKTPLSYVLENFGKPVIIDDVVEYWSALKLWKNKEYFIKEYGQLEVSNEIIFNRTLDVAQDGSITKRTFEGSNLGNFIKEMSAIDPDSTPYSRPFLFQRAKAESSLLSHFIKDIQLPARGIFEDSSGTATVRKKKRRGSVSIPSPPLLTELKYNWHVLSVGGGTGGFPPHKHTAAWFALVVGQKHWTFLPPGAISAVGLDSTDLYAQAALNAPETWSESLQQKLRAKGMRQCMQRPGEVIFVPHLWWHATANVGDAIGIGGQADSLLAAPYTKDGVDENCALSVSQYCAHIDYLITNSNPPADAGLSIGSSSSSSTSEVTVCNSSTVLKNLRRATEIEPLNIKHIRGYAEGLIHYSHYTHNHINSKGRPVPTSLPNPFSRALDYLWTVAREVENQLYKRNFPLVDAHHLIGRVGMWLDKAPPLAQEVLTGISSDVVGEKKGGMNHEMWMGDKDTVELYQFTLDRFSSLYGKLRLDMEQGKDVTGPGANGIMRIIDEVQTLQNKKFKKKEEV